MRTEECSNCGAKARIVRGDYVWKDVDLPVTLKNADQIQCGKCGNTDVIIPKLSQVMRLIAIAVIRKPYRLTGAEVRYLRKHLGMTGADFAGLLRVDKTTLSKWENDDDPVGEQSDRLIRVIAMGLGGGLKEDMEQTIRGFSEIGSASKKIRILVDTKTMSYKHAA